MAISQPLSLPPGFEQLSKTQQIDYVQELWNLIITSPDELPIPDWHLAVVNDRVASQNAALLSPWDEVKQRLLSKYHGR